MDVRDFTEAGYAHRMAFLKQLSEQCEALWGEGTVVCKQADRYANVFNSLQGENRYPIDIAIDAYKANGITPRPIPMRGGYDGAALSQKDYLALISLPGRTISTLFMNIFPLNRFMLPAMY